MECYGIYNIRIGEWLKSSTGIIFWTPSNRMAEAQLDHFTKTIHLGSFCDKEWYVKEF